MTTKKASIRQSLSTGTTLRPRLIINAGKGELPGMLQTRNFQIVLVRKNHGAGVEVTKNPDKVVVYKGDEQTIQLAR